MSNEFEGGNENTYMDSSPESSEVGSDLDSVGSSANEPAMSARDFLSRRQEIKQKAADKMTEAESDSSVAGEEEEASDKKTSASQAEKPADKKEKTDNPRFQQRIDKLTARYHEAERKAAEKDVQIEKLMKATEILQKELERVSKFAKLDPREEKIRELEIQREVDKFANSLGTKSEEMYSNNIKEYEVQMRADEIIDEVNQIVQEYDLASPEEVLIAMRDRNMSAAAAAREIHNSRLQRAQKRITVKHPSTVSKGGAGGTNKVEAPYRGSETIKEFLLQRLAERDGRAE